MGITARFIKESISGDLREVRRKIERDMIQMLNYVGETFVKDARQMSKAQGGFGDVTGNLRSSIGYFVVKDGTVIIENIEGSTAGKSAASVAMSQVKKNDGIRLIGVAGMNYASHVESRGLNVITAQADVCLVNLDRLLKKYASKMGAKGIGITFETGNNAVTTQFT